MLASHPRAKSLGKHFKMYFLHKDIGILDEHRSPESQRKIRLRLHGTRLPKDYTISLHLSAENDNAERAKITALKRRRRPRLATPMKSLRGPSTSRSQSPESEEGGWYDTNSITSTTGEKDIKGDYSATDSDSNKIEDEKRIRVTNAYPGADNTIGSIHQRRWFITLDRTNSGFIRDVRNKLWKRRILPDGEVLGFEPFFVRGSEFE